MIRQTAIVFILLAAACISFIQPASVSVNDSTVEASSTIQAEPLSPGDLELKDQSFSGSHSGPVHDIGSAAFLPSWFLKNLAFKNVVVNGFAQESTNQYLLLIFPFHIFW